MNAEYRVLAVLAVSALPGILVSLCWPQWLPGISTGIALGWAGTVTGAYVLARYCQLPALVPCHIIVTLLLAAVAFRRGGIRKNRRQLSGNAYSVSAMVLLTGVAASYITAALSSSWPKGWDPSFHCILVQKIVDSGTISVDWMPFEPVAVNYTQGLHVLLAAICRITGTTPDVAFRVCQAVVQITAVWLVYDLARSFLGRGMGPALALVSYAGLAKWGSYFSYASWGGLPTQLAAVFFLALIRISCGQHSHWKAAFGIPLCGAIALVHHLTAVMTAWIIVFHAVSTWHRKRDNIMADHLLLSGFGAAICFSPLLLALIRKMGSIGSTHAFAFSEEPLQTPWHIAMSLGMLFTLVSLYGLARLWRIPVKPGIHFLKSWILALGSGYILLDYVYRLTSYVLTGNGVSALTPSRWMTVMAYPLAICAGHGWFFLIRTLARTVRRSNWSTLGTSRISRRLAIGICTIAATAGGIQWAGLWHSSPEPSPVLRHAAAVIRTKTPKNALVIYVDPPEALYWMPYLTWRASLVTPLPASEDRKAMAQKQAFLTNPENLPRLEAWFEERGQVGYACAFGAGPEDLTLVSLRPRKQLPLKPDHGAVDTTADPE